METIDSTASPLISVVMPFKNASKTLRRALESISSQTFAKWEAVIIDDGSTDGGAAIVAQIAKTDTRFRLITAPKNLGAAKARNLGIRAARGRWIAFLDADDVWYPNKLMMQFPLLLSGVPIVFSSYKRVNSNGHTLGIVNARERVSYEDALGGNPIGCLTAVWDSWYFSKAELPCLPMHEDYAFWLKLLREGAEARSVPDVLAQYQVASGSLSSNKFSASISVFSILRAEPGISTTQLIHSFLKYTATSLWLRRQNILAIPAKIKNLSK